MFLILLEQVLGVEPRITVLRTVSLPFAYTCAFSSAVFQYRSLKVGSVGAKFDLPNQRGALFNQSN